MRCRKIGRQSRSKAAAESETKRSSQQEKEL